MAKSQAPQGRVAPKPAAAAAAPAPRTQPRDRNASESRSIQHKAHGSSKQQIQEMNNPQPVAKTQAFRVMATRIGYYDHVRRREGDVFVVDAEHFTDVWMEPVDASTPLRVTSAPEALKREHDKLLGGKVTDNPLDAE